MSEKFDDLDARLKKADPAVSAPEIGEHVLERATNAKPTRSKRARLIGSLSTATAGLAAVLAISLGFTSSSSQLVIDLGANQSNAQGLEGAKLGSMDSMMMPFVQYNFVAAANLSNSEQSGLVYEVSASKNIEQNMVELAKYFGVEGKPTKAAYTTGNDFIIGGDSAGQWIQGKPNIYFSTVTGSFNYSNESAYGTWTCAEKSTDCTWSEDKPAADKKPMPTRAEAIDQAKQIFAAAGLNDQNVKWDYQSGDGYAGVIATLQISGIDAIQYSVYWAPSGQISGASGWCVDIVNRGTFPTVSPAKAVERLNDYRWGTGLPASYYTGAMFYGAMYNDMGVMTGAKLGGSESATSEQVDPAAVDPAQTDPSAAPDATAEPAPSDSATAEPMPVDTATAEPEATSEPLPTPTIQTVEIVKAELTMVTVWDSQGRMWLVPGYALFAEKGLVGGVIALHDGVIKLPEVMPMVK